MCPGTKVTTLPDAFNPIRVQSRVESPLHVRTHESYQRRGIGKEELFHPDMTVKCHGVIQVYDRNLHQRRRPHRAESR